MMFHFSGLGGGHSGAFIAKDLNLKYSEYCEFKCFGELHVYFRFEARKVSSACLLNLLQSAIWPEIVSFCPNPSHFSLLSSYLLQNPALLPPGWLRCFGATSELPSKTTDFDHLKIQIYM